MDTQARPIEPQEAADLVDDARSGCPKAWMELVDQYSGLVWYVINSYRLDAATAQDAVQDTWLTAVEKLDQVRQPDRFGSWIAAVARNTATAEYRRAQRQVLVGSEFDRYDSEIEETDRMVEWDEREALTRAFSDLDSDEQQLLRLTVIDPELSYEDVAWALGRPVGSIGPSRARALKKLRHKYDAAIAAN